MKQPDNFDEFVEDFRKNASDADLAIHAAGLHHPGGMRPKAAYQVQQERKHAIEQERQEEVLAVRAAEQKRDDEHTLLMYWKLAKRDERVGIAATFLGIFLLGYSCASGRWISRFIDLILEIMK